MMEAALALVFERVTTVAAALELALHFTVASPVTTLTIGVGAEDGVDDALGDGDGFAVGGGNDGVGDGFGVGCNEAGWPDREGEGVAEGRDEGVADGDAVGLEIGVGDGEGPPQVTNAGTPPTTVMQYTT
jgi:hypothetical protein